MYLAHSHIFISLCEKTTPALIPVTAKGEHNKALTLANSQKALTLIIKLINSQRQFERQMIRTLYQISLQNVL